MPHKRARIYDYIDIEAREASDDSDCEPSEEEGDLGFVVKDVDPEFFDDENIYQDFGIGAEQEQEQDLIADIVSRAQERARQEKARLEKTRPDSVVQYEDKYVADQALTALKNHANKLWELKVKGRNVVTLVQRLRDEYGLLKSKEQALQATTGLPLQRDDEGKPLPLFSFEVFNVQGLEDRIFIVTNDFARAARKLSSYIADKTAFWNYSQVNIPKSLFPDFEGLDFLREQLSSLSAEKFQFVRFLKKPKEDTIQRNDIAVVIGTNVFIPKEAGSDEGRYYLILAFVPRLDQQRYLQEEMPNNEEAQVLLEQLFSAPSSSKKRKREIPSAILHEIILEHMPRHPLWGNHGCRLYQDEIYKDGLRIISWPDHDIRYLDLNPVVTDQEIQPFSTVRLTFQAVCNHLRDRETYWRRGGRVEVLRGEYMECVGIIDSVDTVNKTVTVAGLFSTAVEMVEQGVVLQWNEVRRAFPLGVSVRVFWGCYKGRTGFILNESNDKLVDIWSEFKENEVNWHDEQEKWAMRGNVVSKTFENVEQGIKKRPVAAKPSLEQFLISVFNEFIEEEEPAPSYQGRRYPHAPGTVNSNFALVGKHLVPQEFEQIGKERLEAAYQYLPQPVGRNPVIPKAIPVRRLFYFDRSGARKIQFVEESLTGPRDSRIGMDALIVKKQNNEHFGTDDQFVKGYGNALKGSRGRITDISPTWMVTIQVAGRLNHTVQVHAAHVVCMNDLTKTMDGTPLMKPIELADRPEEICRPASPMRGLTPQPDVFIDFETSKPEVSPQQQQPHPVDLGECAFLVNSSIGREDWHFWVGFKDDFDEARWVKRRGYTLKKPLDTASSSAEEVHKVVVLVTSNHSGNPLVKHEAPVSMLTRAAPRKKGDCVVILKGGQLYGKQGTVTKCQTGQRKATVQILSGIEDKFSFDDLCTITISDLPLR